MRGASTPVRTCVGCGCRAPQSELLRFVAPEGVLVRGRRRPGRGAYTCRRLECFRRALAQRAFERAFRRPVEVPPDSEHHYADA